MRTSVTAVWKLRIARTAGKSHDGMTVPSERSAQTANKSSNPPLIYILRGIKYRCFVVRCLRPRSRAISCRAVLSGPGPPTAVHCSWARACRSIPVKACGSLKFRARVFAQYFNRGKGMHCCSPSTQDARVAHAATFSPVRAVEKLFPEMRADDQTALWKSKEDIYRLISTKMTPLQGLLAFFDRCQAAGLAMILVTNAPRLDAVHTLKVLGLSHRWKT